MLKNVKNDQFLIIFWCFWTLFPGNASPPNPRFWWFLTPEGSKNTKNGILRLGISWEMSKKRQKTSKNGHFCRILKHFSTFSSFRVPPLGNQKNGINSTFSTFVDNAEFIDLQMPLTKSCFFANRVINRVYHFLAPFGILWHPLEFYDPRHKIS